MHPVTSASSIAPVAKIPAPKVFAVARIGELEGAVLDGEAGAVVHGDADRDLQPAGELLEQVLVRGEQAGERVGARREADERYGQLDARIVTAVASRP